MLIAFFSWWYGQGWKQVIASFGPRLKNVSEAFSVPQLMRTLFSPWRRIISVPGRSLEARLRALADNMFSRVVGFFVRLFVLFAALIVMAVSAVLTILEVVVWPLVPLAVPVFVVLGVAS